MAYFGNPAQYGYASRMAMGLARLRAEHLAAEAVQIAIWDGVASDGPAGTGADVAAWAAAWRARADHRRRAPVDRGLEPPAAACDERPMSATLAAILFTDFEGFSTLEREPPCRPSGTG